MTFANDGFVFSPDCLLLPPSDPSSSDVSMQVQPDQAYLAWASNNWSPWRSWNSIPKPHDSSTFHPACTCASIPTGLPPTRAELNRIYPSPPPTDSDPKHTVPLPLCEDPSLHAGLAAYADPLSLCYPTLPVQDSERPLTSHPNTHNLPLSPPPSLPMVPHALPEAAACCAHSENLDADAEIDAGDGVTQSPLSPHDLSTDLFTPLSPILDLALDDPEARPAGTPEVSALLSRSLVSSYAQCDASGFRAAEGDGMVVAGTSRGFPRDIDYGMEPQGGHSAFSRRRLAD
ncbi:hypothetical protein BC834DRAFT_426702 [Gloeopeniophorella convolvens]|nr:hypothetical protein BC834DRAFT_426702 [Gloeopeniophorella convolvens]